MVSKERINQLHQIILEDYGIGLTDEQSFRVATELVELFDTLIYGKEVEKDGKTNDQDTTESRDNSAQVGDKSQVS